MSKAGHSRIQIWGTSAPTATSSGVPRFGGVVEHAEPQPLSAVVLLRCFPGRLNAAPACHCGALRQMMHQASEPWLHNDRMARDCLEKIEHASFPILVAGEYEVDCLRVLQAAELVEVHISHTQGEADEVATVLRITPLGRAALQRWRLDAAAI